MSTLQPKLAGDIHIWSADELLGVHQWKQPIYTEEEATPTIPGVGKQSTAAYPRMVTISNQPCYVCARKPPKVPVGVLERSATDQVPCCGYCAQYVLGYDVEDDGHLTRKPPEP